MSLKKNPKVDLKRKYQRFMETSLIISLALLVAAFKYFPEIERQEVAKEKGQIMINVEDVAVTRQQAPPPPPPKPPIPIEAPSDDVLDDIEIGETELDVEEAVDAPPPPPAPDVEDDEETINIFVAVEQMPELIGGIASIQKSIVYPEIAIRAGIQGQVLVAAVVDEQGDVMEAEVLRGIGAGCDEEALRAVKEAKFEPGKQRGKAVKVRVTVPVRFSLKSN